MLVDEIQAPRIYEHGGVGLKERTSKANTYFLDFFLMHSKEFTFQFILNNSLTGGGLPLQILSVQSFLCRVKGFNILNTSMFSDLLILYRVYERV